MTRPSLGFAVLVLLGIALPVAHGQQVFRTTTNGVIVSVAVMDGRQPVPGLTRTDFELRDNGVVQDILDLSRDRLPLDITFTLDVSGSVTPAQHEELLHAIQQVRNTLKPDDRYRALAFTRRVREYGSWTSPATPIDLSDPEPAPWSNEANTSALDATALSLLTRRDPDRRQLVIVLTDALENSSFLDAEGLAEAVKYSDAVLDVVVVRDPGRSSPNTLTRAAEDTGGRHVDIGNTGVGEAFLAAIEEFRTSYVLRYTPTGVSSKGWHDVSVKVKNGRYEVRARKGYDAGGG